jgi:hypothetical protein
MVATAFVKSDTSSKTAIERIAGELVRVKPSRGGAILTTPVLFPSGAHVTVHIRLEGERCFISDDGAAFAEADMMGASDIFRRAANHVAEESRIRFNSFEFFEADANLATAAGMIAIVADAAKRAVHITAERLAKRSHESLKAIVVDRLRDVFGEGAVTSEASVSGASTHEWTVDALVRSPAGLMAVEAVSSSYVSVSAAYMKLDDIRRLENAPKTVAALKRMDDFGTDQILILARTARIVDSSGGRDAFARLAS